MSIRTGDLLFRGKTPSALSTAIDEVTQTEAGKHFSHVGLAEVVDNNIFVIHSDGSKGVDRETLKDFMNDGGGDTLYVEAYRLKSDFRDAIPEAMERATALIGEPYNYTYIIEDSGYYCSELVWYAFATDSVFALDPMTFKDPESGAFHEGWVEHYGKLGVEIPEGLPGCNPNGMAGSDKLEYLGVVVSYSQAQPQP
ncbi:YiiX/YebB-like N1pC/P60 family cysteine hydrolase [Marinilabilia salmonicolor]|nr:YiiX/YebB-like N1pC/P60 family cysteine hydrolase [Marinilabilia salmonicolor]